MSKTQYYAAATLDGFIATTDHSLDWLMQFGANLLGDGRTPLKRSAANMSTTTAPFY